MAIGDDAELIDRFEEFYRNYYRDEIGQRAQHHPHEQGALQATESHPSSLRPRPPSGPGSSR